MTPRRASKRTSTVTKSKELEETLQKRREKSEVRVQKAKSKSLQKLVDEEERLFTEEAFRRLSPPGGILKRGWVKN